MEGDRIPPPPSRQEELSYIQKFQERIWNRPKAEIAMYPAPDREFKATQRRQDREYYKQNFGHWLQGLILTSPIAAGFAWFLNPRYDGAFPLRFHPRQHKYRFWTFYAASSLLTTWLYVWARQDRDYRDLRTELNVYERYRKQL